MPDNDALNRAPITEAALELLEELWSLCNEERDDVPGYDGAIFDALPALIAQHRKAMELNAALLEIVQQWRERCESRQDHECGWTPKAHWAIEKAAELIRTWEGTK